MVEWDKRDKKKIVRNYVCGIHGGNEKQGIILAFPSVKMLDIILALENGTIDTTQPIIVVERDHFIAVQIKSQLLALGFTKIYIHNGKLEDLDLEYAINQVADGTHLPQISWGFIDTCGQLTAFVAAWFATIPKHCLMDNLHLHVAFAYFRDKSWRDFFNENNPAFDGEIEQWWSIFRTHNGKKIDVWLNCEAEIIGKMIITSLGNFSVKAKRVQAYHDTQTWMYCYHLIVNKKQTFSRFLGLKEAIKQYNEYCFKIKVKFNPYRALPSTTEVVEKEITATKKEIVMELTAGKKAWITRKARAAGKNPIMVLAGYKAAQTRKANAEGKDPVMVEAGRKAWATRRRNLAAVV